MARRFSLGLSNFRGQYHMLHKLLAVAAWMALGLLVFVTISPLETRPIVTENANIERFAAFAMVGLLFGLAYPRRLAIDASFVVIAAGVLETLQLLTPDRHGHIADAFIKAVGGAFGVAVASIALVMARRFKARVNQ
jgi:VanZ family protein